MENGLSIAELVKNGTLSAEMAALLWSAVEEKVSFLTAALYQNAGKSTLSKAILSLRSSQTPIHNVPNNPELMNKLLKLEKHGGYLVVQEFSPTEIAGYIWGEEVKAVFDKLQSGYSLSACIHANNPEDAIYELIKSSGISDTDVSAIKLVLYIDMFGTSLANAKRRLTNIYELHYMENGKPVGHSVYSWNKQDDSFEKVSEQHGFAGNKDELSARTDVIRSLVDSGKTSSDEVLEAVEDFRKANP